MTNLLSDRRVVGALAIVASLFVYLRIVAPMLPDQNLSSVDDPPIDAGLDDIAATSSLAAPRLVLATAQYDLRNIDIGALQFNENPSRDPFVDRPAIVAPLAAVDISQPVETRRSPLKRTVAPVLPQLTAIAFGQNNRAAVLDDRIVRIGDAVGSFRVTDIARTRVVLRTVRDNAIFTLNLAP